MSLTFLSILAIFSLQNLVFSSPVLLWSNTKLPETNVHLGTISSLDIIDDSICALSAKQIQLRLFAVQDLTIEDIQRGSYRNHPVLLNAKLNTENFHFYPNVANDIYSKLSLIPQSNDFKCSKIHFQIGSANIYENLEDALNIIQTTMDNTNQDQIVVIALTSTDTPSRKRRSTEQNSNEILRSFDQSCMLYVEKLRYNNVTGTKYNSQNYSLNYNASSCVPAGVNATTVTLNLVWTNDNSSSDTLTMLLTTILKGRYWYLQNATIGNTNQYRYFAYGMHSQMDTPPTYSYVCNSAVFIRYNATDTAHGRYNFSDQFFLTGFQFQPYNSNGSYFGPPNYCTSFFTSGIWMGITSSLLCLGILLIGIHRMMTIKSNDRFDDPKGKPLIIKAQE